MGVMINGEKKVTGYQIQVAKDSKFKNIVRESEQKKVKYLAKKLAKKNYYVRIRAYKKTGKKIFVGAWSSVKKVRVY